MEQAKRIGFFADCSETTELDKFSLAEENDLNILLYSATFQLLAQNVNNFRFSKFGKRVICNKMNQNCVRIYLRHIPFPVRNSINI